MVTPSTNKYHKNQRNRVFFFAEDYAYYSVNLINKMKQTSFKRLSPIISATATSIKKTTKLKSEESSSSNLEMYYTNICLYFISLVAALLYYTIRA